MARESLARNPFMLMTNPEVVVAAMQRSERLGQLNRHLCRPLDRQHPSGASTSGSAPASQGIDEADEDATTDPSSDRID